MCGDHLFVSVALLYSAVQVLFNDTIKYNIKYAKPNATDEEVGSTCAVQLATVGGVAC